MQILERSLTCHRSGNFLIIRLFYKKILFSNLVDLIKPDSQAANGLFYLSFGIKCVFENFKKCFIIYFKTKLFLLVYLTLGDF